jgi:hypothetical protein
MSSVSVKVLKTAALLIGINYTQTPEARLNGCVNDVKKMSEFLTQRMGFKPETISMFHDEDPILARQTTALGILTQLRKLAIDSWRFQYDIIWIHYSGHGVGIRDRSGDEKDGQDECIIPSDYKRFGIITDDFLKTIIRNFNPKTKVFAVFDSCHSGSILDLKYRFVNNVSMAEEFAGPELGSRVISLSGCRDDQTSADAYNVLNNNQFIGALTACLMLSYEPACNNDVFLLLRKVHNMLRTKGFTQYPQLCCTYDLRRDARMLL